MCQSGLLGSPPMNKSRNGFCSQYLKTQDINVDNCVRINPAHPNFYNSVDIDLGLRASKSAEIYTTGGIWIGQRATNPKGAVIFTHDQPVDGKFVDWRLHKMRHSNLVTCRDAWIGARTVILSTVNRISRDTIAAAGVCVKKVVQDFHIVASVPARSVRIRRIVSADRDTDQIE